MKKNTRRASERATKQSVDALTMAAAMPVAAMVTLSHRLPMLAGAAAGSNAWSDPEFQRMAEEKVQTVGQAALTMGDAAMAGQQAIVNYAAAQTRANLNLLTSLPSSPAAAFAFGSASLQRLTRLTADLSDIGTQSVATGLRPAHKKVTANARRLSGRKKSR